MTATSIGLIISFLTMTAVAAKLLLENKKLKSRLSKKMTSEREISIHTRRLLLNIAHQKEKVQGNIMTLLMYLYPEQDIDANCMIAKKVISELK